MGYSLFFHLIARDKHSDVVEMLTKDHPRTLFATHYHELNEMEKNFSRIKTITSQ